MGEEVDQNPKDDQNPLKISKIRKNMPNAGFELESFAFMSN